MLAKTGKFFFYIVDSTEENIMVLCLRLSINGGGPRDTILGPVLFSLMLNDDFTLSIMVKGSNDCALVEWNILKPLLVDKQSILLTPKTRFLGGK